MDPDLIEQAITPRTKAIVPVHFTGQPCDMAPISDIARRHDLRIVEDAAHAFRRPIKESRSAASATTLVFVLRDEEYHHR